MWFVNVSCYFISETGLSFFDVQIIAQNSIKSMTTCKEELNEAHGASSCLKANVVGKIKRGDFQEIYERDASKEALGSGMTGTVHEWKHKITGQCVAIKCVQKRGLAPRVVDSMRDEIQLLAQLDHPNIVKIIDAFENDNNIALVMEVCDGLELFDHIAIQAQFTQKVCVPCLFCFCMKQTQYFACFQKAAWVFKQMVGAVGYCHKMHVAHRDLKCVNSMQKILDV